MFHFGKYKNVPMEEVPSSYLKWMISKTNRELGKQLAKEELLKRMLLQFEYQDEIEEDFAEYASGDPDLYKD